MVHQLTMKSRPLGKEEVTLLLDNICKHKIITAKATNATNNKLKEEAWKEIATEFSASIGETRRPEQLRLKWENLKKAARKRNAIKRQNNSKSGGGKFYIPPDETLDRVASMLGAMCDGFSVDCSGEADSEEMPIATDKMEGVIKLESKQFPQTEFVMMSGNTGSGGDDGSGSSSSDGDSNYEATPKKMFFITPKSSSMKKQKLKKELQIAQREKELAMASYYRAKTEKVQLENQKLKLEIEMLKQTICQ